MFGGRLRSPTLAVLFLLSGVAALIYQVLWVRELGLLFGSTAQAAAITIAIFFGGLAAGGWYWGRRAAAMASPLRGFGLLEVGVAGAALGHFVLTDIYHALAPSLHSELAVVDTLLKALVAAVILLPPSFLMGGTFPLMAQHVVRRPDRLGTSGPALYAVNTAGGATGALAAGLVLPLALGYRGAYLLAVGIDLAVGVGAVLLARRAVEVPAAPVGDEGPADPDPGAEEAPAPPAVKLPEALVTAIAFGSGAATIGVEVVWTRLAAQVLQNSAATYAVVLATFLLALAAGSAVASALSRLARLRPEAILTVLLLLAGVATAASPVVFHLVTGGLTYLGGDRAWGGYLAEVARMAGLSMFVPGVALGTVLPYLLRVRQGPDRAAGSIVGQLVAANTCGAVLGSLATGFVLLPAVGASRSLLVLAAAYPLMVAGVALVVAGRQIRLPAVAALASTALLLVTITPAGLVEVRLRPGRGERVIEVRDGPQATVAVIGRGRDRLIRVNNWYTLGGSEGFDREQNQSVIPMLTHPAPRSVFHLGMGTGITAGATLAFPVERVVVCELIDDVVAVARSHFDPWVNGLFDDPRAQIHAEDGRACLRRSHERFDVINSDLFTPWEAGTGNLYTVEHYRTARDRLAPGGVYVQWIPLYQVSDRELGIIARTMDEVFPEVVLWRGDLFAERSIVALVGHRDPEPLDPRVVVERARSTGTMAVTDDELEALALRLYAGNITASGIYADRPLNTDSRPRIEHLAPRTHREVRAGRAQFLVGGEREALYDRLVDALDPAEDPYLAGLDGDRLDLVRAGRSWSALRFAERVEDGAASGHRRDLADLGVDDLTVELSPARLLLRGARPADDA